jgi:hypothetical protein
MENRVIETIGSVGIKRVNTVVTLFKIINFNIDYTESRGSSGSILSDYGLDDRGSIPDRGRGFFF